jgi:hypothetical protein
LKDSTQSSQRNLKDAENALLWTFGLCAGRPVHVDGLPELRVPLRTLR